MKLFNSSTPILVLLLGLLLSGCASSGRPSVPSSSGQLQMAEVMFQDRCKVAGEKILRTVESVEGVFLMKLRPGSFNFGDQYSLDDPYGHDSTGERYIVDFVGGYSRLPKDRDPNAPPHNGFSFVEAIDPRDGKRYRYTGSFKEVTHTSSLLMGGDGKTTFKSKDFVLDRVPATGAGPRYGVTFDDISTREEREYWIAGSSLKVIDLETNEVIAERIGYMMDRGQGSKAGGRSPWLLAANHACPGFQRNPSRPIAPGHGSSAQDGQTLDFVEKVLKPKLN